MLPSESGVRPIDDRHPPHEAVRSQLERILESPLFKRSTRLTRFLEYVVEQTLAGQAETLKEPVLALELYGRSDFDSGLDPVVRVDARRLRDKLREYYGDSPNEPVVISLPKGSYVPAFEFAKAAIERAPAIASTEVVGARENTRRQRTRILAASGLVAAVVAALLYYFSPGRPSTAVLRPLASLPGKKGPPSLSPSGDMVVFFWSGPPDKPLPGIYIKSVDGEDLRWLTSAQANADPAWSPGGPEIAFSRTGSNAGVFVISQLGGVERQVSSSGTSVAWTPDGTTVLFQEREPFDSSGGAQRSAIFSVSLKTLEKRRLTLAPIPMGDLTAAVSPDGATVAFIRSGIPGLRDIYVVPLSGGEPRRLTDWNGLIDGLAWTPDSEEIIYGVDEPIGPRLWRISARTSSPGRGVRLAESTGDALLPTISRRDAGGHARLAYLTRRLETSLRLVDLTSRDASGALSGTRLFQRSSRWDYGGRFSPDGKLTAFISNRAGTPEIWISGMDGSNLRRLTDIKGDPTFATWSKDSRAIAFTSAPGGVGVKRIYVVSVDGGDPKPLTGETELALTGSWSRDGQWLYFMSDRTGSFQIWKMSPAGDHPVQVTRNGGFEAQESPDGQYLYYTDKPPGEPSGREAPVRLMRVPVNGGEEIPILPQVWTFHWTATDIGICYFSPGPPRKSILLYRFDTGRTERIGDLPDQEAELDGDMAVSRDGRLMFMSQIERDDTDLMIIDGFR